MHSAIVSLHLFISFKQRSFTIRLFSDLDSQKLTIARSGIELSSIGDKKFYLAIVEPLRLIEEKSITNHQSSKAFQCSITNKLMLKLSSGQNTLLSLLLLVSAASIGTAMALFIAPGTLGQIIFSICKIWLLMFPLAWFFWVDGGKLSLSLPKQRELLAGGILGLLMFGVILGVYLLFGQQLIDAVDVRIKAQEVGISSSNIYVAGAIYWTLINSLIEEYIWRWFVYSKCEKLVPGIGAVLLCGLFFILHHIIALAAYTELPVVILGSLGVFIAGALWSFCYLNFRSIWSGYLSHILADLAIAIVGWHILFGS